MKIFLAVIFLLTSACQLVLPPQETPERIAPRPIDTREALKNAKHDFETVNRLIIQPKCINCHNPQNSKGDVLLSDFDQVTANIDELRDVLTENSMPPARKKGETPIGLPEHERDFFLKWLDLGAPKEPLDERPVEAPTPEPGNPETPVPTPGNPEAPTPDKPENPHNPTPETPAPVNPNPPQPEPGQPNPAPPETGSPEDLFKNAKLDYQTVNQLIFKPKCLKCHSVEEAPEKGDDVILDNLKEIKLNLKSLKKVIRKNIMPPAKNEGEKPVGLPDYEREYLNKWLDLGAPENAL